MKFEKEVRVGAVQAFIRLHGPNTDSNVDLHEATRQYIERFMLDADAPVSVDRNLAKQLFYRAIYDAPPYADAPVEIKHVWDSLKDGICDYWIHSCKMNGIL